MPQEPRSFFERLTGARVLSSSDATDTEEVLEVHHPTEEYGEEAVQLQWHSQRGVSRNRAQKEHSAFSGPGIPSSKTPLYGRPRTPGIGLPGLVREIIPRILRNVAGKYGDFGESV